MDSKRYKKGMVFGVFDGLHEGHKAFITEALGKCGTLVVVLTRTEVSEALKKRKPRYSYEDRLNALLSYNSSLIVVSGDPVLGEWKVIDREQPDIIFLGYDQGAGIISGLQKKGMAFERLNPYKSEIYKSSLLNK